MSVFDGMQPGDSFFVALPKARLPELRREVRAQAKRSGRSFTIKPASENGQDGYRCWCQESIADLLGKAELTSEVPLPTDRLAFQLKKLERDLRQAGMRGMTKRDLSRNAAYRRLDPTEQRECLEGWLKSGQLVYVNVNEGSGKRRRDAYVWAGE